MKITLGLGYLAVGQLITDVALDRNDTIARITEKRYQQLITQMNFYNKDFDARRFWAYGCNCLILGDRPMSEAGLGPPVDDLDASCKKYKECLKCAKMEFGDQCISEFVKYKFLVKGEGVQCRNRYDTCERSLCECDKLLAKSHSRTAEVWDEKYHLFSRNWSPEESCPQTRSAKILPVQNHECCNGPRNGQAFGLYNINNQECCNNGEIANIGEC